MLNKKEESKFDATFDIFNCYSEVRECPNRILNSKDMAAKLKEIIIEDNLVKRINNSSQSLSPH